MVSPAKTAGAWYKVIPKAVKGARAVKLVLKLRDNLPVHAEITLPIKDNKGIQSKVIM
ncbi:hypothetical protein PA7559_20010 [Pseudoalteromonas distincta]|jgi:hypothetical protein|nr:hypothetical protein PH505_af00250 [Pseudoalteromonas distincta]|tara:strand:- start:2640 stop:2813 length:174 start_codon:yes stop_codon:yes gene_type:complete